MRPAASTRPIPTSEVISSDHLVHHEIADDYRRLVEHQVRDLALHMGPARGSLAAAQRVAALCDVLFTAVGPDEAGLDRLLGARGPEVRDRAGRTFDAARALHTRILGTGHQFWWDRFMTSPVLAEGRQSAWGACDPQDPIAFIIAPAYVVEGRLYGPQLVYTQPR